MKHSRHRHHLEVGGLYSAERGLWSVYRSKQAARNPDRIPPQLFGGGVKFVS